MKPKDCECEFKYDDKKKHESPDIICPKCGKISIYDYKTLEEELTECFTKRDIEVESIEVKDGCKTYTIKVNHNKWKKNKMKTLVIMVGPQGAGKTEYCNKTFGLCTYISQDRTGRWHRRQFEEAIKRRDELIVIDNTNPSVKQRARYIPKAKEVGYKIKIVWFDIDKQVCIKRIKERKNHPTLKPEKAEEALDVYYSKFEPPTKKEADEISLFQYNIK